MLNIQLIRDKLEQIKLYYQELEEILKHSLTDIKVDFIKYHAIKRLLQLIVDEMLDINNHIISRLNLSSPDDFQSTFKILSENNIIPRDFAEQIAPVVGLRNHLVHRYEKIDRSLVLEQIQKEKSDFREYIELIDKYLKEKEKNLCLF